MSLLTETVAPGSRAVGESALVSVAMATWNGARYVREQLESVAAQTHDELEIVISDDGSDDGTYEICEEFARHDSRVHLLPRVPERRGFVRNFERALRATTGEFIALADQDDVWRPEKVAVQLRRLQSDGRALLVFSDLSVVDADRVLVAASMWSHQRIRVPTATSLRHVLARNCVTGCAALFHRELLARALPFPERCMFHDWWLAVVAAAGGGLRVEPRALVEYRQHGENAMGATGAGGGRLVRLLRRTADAVDCGRYERELERLRDYERRPDVFSDEAARRDLSRTVDLFQRMAGARGLGLIERFRLLRDRWRYYTAHTLVDGLIAVGASLLPELSERALRSVQARLRATQSGA